MSRALLAQIDEAPLLSEALMLMVVGMLVVFAALVLLLLAIVLINWLGADTEAESAETALAPAKQSRELTPQTLVVLAAAATVALRRPVRVNSARRIERGESSHG